MLRPTSENHSHDFSTPSRHSQDSTVVVPPSSQPPYIPTLSNWSPDSVMLQQQMPQSPLTNQVSSYNSQPMQPPGVFSLFPMSQPTDMAYSQQQPLSPLHLGPYGAVQSSTIEDLQCAYELMMMWFQRPPIHQPLPPPPTPTQPSTTFHIPLCPPTKNPPISTQLEAFKVPDTPVPMIIPRQGSTDLSSALLDLGNLSGGLSSDAFDSPTPSSIQSEATPLSLPLDDPGPVALLAPPHTHPKLFEHDVGKPIMFCVPIILRNCGKIAEIFRVSFQPSLAGSRPKNTTSTRCGIVLKIVTSPLLRPRL